MNETCWAASVAASLAPYLVPSLAILGAFSVGIAAMVLKSRERERLHRERMFLAEKGLEIPRELYGIEEKRPSDYRTTRIVLLISGVFMIVTGVGAFVGIGMQEGFREASPAFVASALGIGLVISERMIARRFVSPKEERRTE
jgi:hypothetical protein